jgi:hypothetical protein
MVHQHQTDGDGSEALDVSAVAPQRLGPSLNGYHVASPTAATQMPDVSQKLATNEEARCD